MAKSPSRPSLRAERKIATILFCDIKGSLELIANLDPEDADDLLTRTLDKMVAAIEEYGGTVNRIAGDGIMAMFGAPVAREQHAQLACCAALGIVRAMRTAHENENRPAAINVRVGLHSGEVLVRTTKTEFSFNYDAVGEVVHVAARMEQNASPNTILITADTRRLAEASIGVRSLGLQSLKGLARPTEVFELLDAVPTRIQGAGAAATPFVGRDDEVKVLVAAAELAVRGTGQAIGLAGEAGCGKSRLLQEFLATLARDDWLICRGQGVSFGRSGYQVVLGLIRDYFRILPAEYGASGAAKIAQHALSVSGEIPLATVEALKTLCDPTAGGAAWQVLDPSERRARIANAVCELFQTISRKQKLALVVEDLHWTDVESDDVLDLLIRLAATERVCILGSYRPEYDARWSDLPHCRELAIEALPPQETTRLLEMVLLPGPHHDELQKRLISLTRGNPLFIEECLMSLADTGALERVGPAYRVRGPVTGIELPSTLRALLASRIDRVPDVEKDVLQAASVVGQTVSADLLGQIVEMAPSRLASLLENLVNSRFITLLEEMGEGATFEFSHALARDAVYADILQRNRTVLHGKALQAIEARYADRLAERIEALAEHALLAQAWPKAADYCRKAGRKAVSRSSNEEGVRLLKLALDAAKRCNADPKVIEAQADILLELRYPLFKLGRTAEVAQYLESAAPLAEVLADARRLTLLHTYMSHIRWLSGDQAAALMEAQYAVRFAEAAQDAALRSRARFQEGLVWYARADFPQAIQAIEGVLDHALASYQAGSYPDRAITITARCYLSRIHAESGDFEAAQSYLDAAIMVLQNSDEIFSRFFVATAAGYLSLCRGDSQAAIAALEQAQGFAVAAQAPLMLPASSGFLGQAYVQAGHFDKAMPVLNEALAKAEATGHLVGQAVRLATLARACIACGHLAEGKIRAQEALARARRQMEPAAEAAALFAIAEAQLSESSSDRSAALESTRQALAIAEEHGLKPLARDCRHLLSAIGAGTYERITSTAS